MDPGNSLHIYIYVLFTQFVYTSIKIPLVLNFHKSDGKKRSDRKWFAGVPGEVNWEANPSRDRVFRSRKWSQ